MMIRKLLLPLALAVVMISGVIPGMGMTALGQGVVSGTDYTATPAIGSLSFTATYGDTMASVESWLDRQNPLGVNNEPVHGTWSWTDTTVQASDSVGNVGTHNYPATFTPSDPTNYNSITKDVEITVCPKQLNVNGVSFSEAEFTYNGSQQAPTVTVQDTDATVTANDYTVSYQKKTGESTWAAVSEAKDAGDYKVCVSGQANYTGRVVSPA